jgi:hypothetical protein
VYEYHGGHVYLISDGRDTSKVTENGGSSVDLIGSDATGANVFFGTADRLVERDTDTQLDVYDARICTTGDPCIAPPQPPPPPCLGETCHGTPAVTPAVLTPGTATFSGAGNLSPPAPTSVKRKTAAQIKAENLAKALRACRVRRNKHKRKACESRARKKYGARPTSTAHMGGK